MSIVTVSEARLHCRASSYVDSPDPESDLFTMYIAAAETAALNYLNRNTLPNNEAIKVAVLMMVATLYDARHADMKDELKPNPAVERLLYPYRLDIGV